MIAQIRHKILCIYAPNNSTKRQDFFREILEKEPSNLPTIWGGDFNCVEIESLDREGPSTKSTHTVGSTEIKSFNTVMELCDPFRINNPTAKEYTFRGITNENGITPRSRIDRIYIPKTYMAKQVTSFHPTAFSDHHMVVTTCTLANTQPKVSRGPGLWKLNTQILNDEVFVPRMNEIIDDYIDDFSPTEADYENLHQYWDILKQTIKKYSSEYTRKKRRKESTLLDNALKDLEKEQLKPNSDQNIIDQCKITIAQAEKNNIETLLFRAKLDQIELDESPTKYFYKRMQIRAENSNIDQLYDSNKILQTDPDEVLSISQKYYADLYDLDPSEICEESQDEILKNLDKRISIENKEILEKELTLNDLKLALKHTKNNKTAGFDGLPYEFYKTFPQLLPVLLKVANYSIRVGHMSPSQQIALLVLIHKKGDKANLDNWRPISLLCTDLKIISKAIAFKIRAALPDIIHHDQTAGVPRRAITDNLWLARDIFNYSAEQRVPGYLISLDQSKAFDRVNHQFLDKVLNKFGFGPKLRNWIKTLYSGSRSYIQNNGHLSLPAYIKRGVRQGCPLSAYLYTIVIETLAQSIRKDTQIKGYPIPNLETVKTSLYADDAHIYINRINKVTSMNRLTQKLKLYEKASGSKLNLDKSQITAFGGTPDSISNEELALEMISEFADSWKIQTLEMGVEILGIIFKATPEETYATNYQIILEKMEERISFLRLRQLSIQGRGLALDTLVLPQVWYVATVIPLCTITYQNIHKNKPNYLKLIQGVANKYLWNNNHQSPLLKTEILKLPLERGGLGIRNIGMQSIALRSKQINYVLDQTSNIPSTRLARYWLATPYLSRLHRGTFFLQNYIPEVREHPLPFQNQTTSGYQSLDLLLQKTFIKPLYKDLENLPSSNQIYKKLLRENSYTIKGEIRWRSLGLPRPQWQNSWQNLAPPIHQEKLWKTKHFILHQSDRIDSQKNTISPKRKCSFCVQSKVIPAPDDTHLHALSLCPQAKETWDKLHYIIRKINYAALPSRKQDSRHKRGE